MAEIPVLLMAAGGSTRMGQPKQLLPWGNSSLIEHQIGVLKKTQNPVIVVLGFNADQVVPIIEKTGVQIVINGNWEKGMGGSISLGIRNIFSKFPDADGALITLLDQPMVTYSYLEKMKSTFKPWNSQILVSQSGTGWEGVPVLFDKCYFNDLAKLCNDEGAKKVIQKYEDRVMTLNAGNILEDIDTPESYKLLLGRYKGLSGE